ncbi:MAG: hypothetical protein ABII13_04255, partial [Patescibacteria group bacterium]
RDINCKLEHRYYGVGVEERDALSGNEREGGVGIDRIPDKNVIPREVGATRDLPLETAIENIRKNMSYEEKLYCV